MNAPVTSRKTTSYLPTRINNTPPALPASSSAFDDSPSNRAAAVSNPMADGKEFSIKTCATLNESGQWSVAERLLNHVLTKSISDCSGMIDNAKNAGVPPIARNLAGAPIRR